MQRKFLTNCTQDKFFTQYLEASYTERLRQTKKRFNQFTPQDKELSPYKLHVSLHKNDYVKYKDKILEIARSHLEAGTVNIFKFTNEQEIENTIEYCSEVRDSISEYKKLIARNEEVNFQLEKSFLQIINEYFRKDYDSSLDLSTLDNMLLLIGKTIQTAVRFIDGDQFTIYLPADFDRDKIVQLCAELESCLQENQALPGEISDVAVPIGEYTNLRQEFLRQDFEFMNEYGMLLKKRINAVNTSELDDYSRTLVVEELNTSSLLNYLRSKLTPLAPLNEQHASSALFQPASALSLVKIQEEEKITPQNRKKSKKQPSRNSNAASCSPFLCFSNRKG